MREVDPHRGAPTPRFWPYAWIAPSLSFAFSYPLITLLGWPGMILSVVGAVAVGVAASALRWRLWRRRHPLRPCGPHCALILLERLDGEAERQREVAKWQ